MTPPATHEVLNQPPPLAGHDVAADPALLEALGREGGGAVLAELHDLGVLAGSPRAGPAPSAGDGAHLLTGHKWFNSAPMCDLFLVLAQGPGGLTCFLLPRVLPDGTRNAIRIQRLKDKLGNRSNASAEIEYDGPVGRQARQPGRAARTIIAMVT